jgi:competence protein ComGD
MDRQAGFTLIEMLAVLSIFLVMAAVTAVFVRPQYLMFEKEQFYSQLKGDLLYAQQYAISRQQPVVVYLRPKENRYFIVQRSNNQRIVERDIPSTVKIGQGTLKNIFEFGHDGRIAQFGTIGFSVDGKNYEIHIQIGVGRIRIVKK